MAKKKESKTIAPEFNQSQVAEPTNIYQALQKILNEAFDGAICIGGKLDSPGQVNVFYNGREPTVMLQMLFTAALNVMQLAMEIHHQDASEDKPTAQEYKEQLYDFFNLSASKVLEIFAPDIEMRPNLTAEAILKAENEILTEGDNDGGNTG